MKRKKAICRGCEREKQEKKYFHITKPTDWQLFKERCDRCDSKNTITLVRIRAYARVRSVFNPNRSLDLEQTSFDCWADGLRFVFGAANYVENEKQDVNQKMKKWLVFRQTTESSKKTTDIFQKTTDFFQKITDIFQKTTDFFQKTTEIMAENSLEDTDGANTL